MASVTLSLRERISQWRTLRNGRRFWYEVIDKKIDALIMAERLLVSNSMNEDNRKTDKPIQQMPVSEKMKCMLEDAGEQNHHIEQSEMQTSSFESPFQSQDADDDLKRHDEQTTSASHGTPTAALRETLGDVLAQLDAMQPFDLDGALEEAFQANVSKKDAILHASVQSTYEHITTDALLSDRSHHQALGHQRDIDVDRMKIWLTQQEHLWLQDKRYAQSTVRQMDRRKVVDARKTVKAMARTAGVFEKFAYRPSPTRVEDPIIPLHLLVIGDVSGSMGKYMATVLYLLSSLKRIAKVESYVFSDVPTYTTTLLGEGTFRTQFARLKSSAKSWEYGTQLDVALQLILNEHKYRTDTTVVLFTDGGFSLNADGFEVTQRAMRTLKNSVERIVVAAPNEDFVTDGPSCGEEFWRVQHMAGVELMTPWLQKVARFGLLAQYSDKIVHCQSTDDFKNLLAILLCPQAP